MARGLSTKEGVMRKRSRLLVLACTAFAALGIAADALAAYTPRLIITQANYRLARADSVGILVSIPQADDATARITIRAPAGYTARLNHAPGTRIGTVFARVLATALGNAPLPLSGQVVVGNPGDPQLQGAAARCTG